VNSLAELFPDGDFRFHLTLRRGEPQAFFRNQDATGTLLKERQRWLSAAPTRYSCLSAEGSPLLAEFVELCNQWSLLDGKNVVTSGVNDAVLGPDMMRELGAALEPDLLFLAPDVDGQFRLRGGALCFPTGWSLTEKMGQTLDSIHGVVPGLNPAIGFSINQFLAKLKPCVAFQRDNWGISATEELNLHPARELPFPQMPIALESLWLRVEHQALVGLPTTKGVVFGIRIAAHRLDHLPSAGGEVQGLIRALQTMPAAMAEYKKIGSIRAPLIEALRSHYVL